MARRAITAADGRLALEELGFEPKTPLHQGLSAQLAWMQAAEEYCPGRGLWTSARPAKTGGMRDQRRNSKVRTALIITAAVAALALPSAALAQGGYGPAGACSVSRTRAAAHRHVRRRRRWRREGRDGAGGLGRAGRAGERERRAAVHRLDLLVIAGIGMALVGAGVGLRRLRDNP